MTIVNMNVQGADGISRDVPLDSIVGQDYDVPVYKLTIGNEGDDDGMVSATNPLPVTIAETPLPDDAATETTLAEINAKVTDDPATATNQETIIGHVDGIETLLAGGLPAELGTGGGLKIDGSGTELPATITQNVQADPNNSSTTNLTSANSYTFTGTATSTLGVIGLQWSLKTDQNATVYVEQSPDGTNWDISYSYDYNKLFGGQGETVQATQSYWRIRVVLTGTVDTTYFRLQGVLCPVATPLPSSLSDDSRLKSESTLCGRENTDRHVWVSPTLTISTNPTYRLAGTTFDGTTKDPNFWTETVTNSGSVVQNGEIKLQTNTTANGTAQYQSVRRARFVASSALQFVGIYKFNDANVTDNIRRFGAYDDNNGYFFQLDGDTFSVGTRKDTVDTLVSSGSFNGNYGAMFSPSNSLYYKFTIEYAPNGAFYYINNKLLHKSLGGHLTRFLTLPVRMENNNDNGNNTAVIMDCLGVAIVRLGELTTTATYKYLSGAATTVLKYGAGDLHSVVNCNNAGTITLYDNTAGSGTVIAVIDASKVLGTMTFEAPFNIGLTAVTTGAVSATITYE